MKDNEVKPPECRKLKAVTFRDAVTFAGTTATHFALRDGPQGEGDRLTPVVLQPSGDWATIDKGQHANGIGIQRLVQRGTVARVERCFVPFTNILHLSYDTE